MMVVKMLCPVPPGLKAIFRCEANGKKVNYTDSTGKVWEAVFTLPVTAQALLVVDGGDSRVLPVIATLDGEPGDGFEIVDWKTTAHENFSRCGFELTGNEFELQEFDNDAPLHEQSTARLSFEGE